MAEDKQTKKILKERADRLRMPIENEEGCDKSIEGLEFLLANERYLIETSYVLEVVKINELTPLPCTPDFILGLINMKGKILSVVDVKRFFKLPNQGITNLNRVIVVKYKDIELGILADEILGSSPIYLDALQRQVTAVTKTQENFIMGLTDARALVFDIKKFLSSEHLIINEKV